MTTDTSLEQDADLLKKVVAAVAADETGSSKEEAEKAIDHYLKESQ